MNIMTAHLELLPLGIFAIAVVFAAITDIRLRLIPNTVSITVALAWLAHAALAGTDVLSHALTGFILLVLGILAFSRGWLGGGDAKLLAACALWMGPGEIAPFLFQTALAGGAMALLWRLEAPVRFALVRGGMNIQLNATRELPYGLAIAIGALLAVSRLTNIS